MVLPTNKQLMQELSLLSDSWEQRLSTDQSVYTLLYSLQIVESLLEERSEQSRSAKDHQLNNSSWREGFVKAGGLQKLELILMSDCFSSLDSKQSNACMGLLLKVFHRTVAGKSSDNLHGGDILELLCEDEAQLASLVHRIMSIFQSSAMAEGGQKDHQDFCRQTVALHAIGLLETFAGVCNEVSSIFSCIYSFPGIKEWVADALLQCKSEVIRKVR